MGYTESRYVAGVPNRNVFDSFVILDGQVAGRWRRTVRKDAVLVDVTLHAPFDGAQAEALRAAAARYGEFLGLPAEVTAVVASTPGPSAVG